MRSAQMNLEKLRITLIKLEKMRPEGVNKWDMSCALCGTKKYL
jgi:alpha-D-ribose 1-methylphosphonate 5-phosphate C-P lyase